jgi:hypothetical protein
MAVQMYDTAGILNARNIIKMNRVKKKLTPFIIIIDMITELT